MENSAKQATREKEYLTIEQRKVVNWYRRVLQVRDTALLVIDLGPLLRHLAHIQSVHQAPYTDLLSTDSQTLAALARYFYINDVNESALDLFGYTDKKAFLEADPGTHIVDYGDVAVLLSLAILEERRHIEIEATARHFNEEQFKISIELILPCIEQDDGIVIVSVACLSDADQLSVKQFQDQNVYTSFVDHAPVCIHEIDQEGRLESMNSAGLTMMEVDDVNEIKGLYYLDLVEKDDRARIEKLLQRAHEGYSSEFEFTLVVNDSTRVFTSCFIPMEKTSESKRRIIGVTQDITERKASEEELYRSANYDPLTKLRNRPNFMDSANQLLAQASRHEQQLAFLFIDLDNFKPVNDTFGHDVGDLALQEFSSKLLSVLREEDIACRFGGDEFVVLLPYIEHAEDAEDVAHRLIEILKQPFSASGLNSSVQGSIGISIYPKDGISCKELIRRADEAMYEAKRAGGNQARFYSP